MKKSNLLQILSSFSSGEVKEFSDYLHSPFFNKSKGVVKLYSYLRKHYPEFSDESISKKTVWQNAFPGAPYNDGLLRNQMFTLTNLAMDFLLYKELKEDKFLNGNYMLRYMNNRGLTKQFERTSAQLVKEYTRIEKHDENYFYNRYYFELENTYFLHKIYFDRNEKIVGNKGIMDFAVNAALFQITVMLKSYMYLLNVKNLYETAIEIREYEEFMQALDIKKFSSTPVIPILYLAIKLLTDEDNLANFEILKNLLKNSFRELTLNDSVDVIINMENYCKKMIREGKSEYEKHLFDIYIFELENKTYKAEHSLSNRMYIGVIETAIRLGKHKWTATFIEDYKNELDETARDSTYTYANAIYEFSVNNFNEALSLLQSAGYNDVYNKFKQKTLIIACYYELNMFDKMEGVMDSYRHLLTNDKFISKERKKYYSNYITVAKKLIRLKTKYNPYKANEIREMIKNPGFVIDSKWIERKVTEAENKNSSK